MIKKAYTLLSPGLASDTGVCLMIDESLGRIILGEILPEEVPDNIIADLAHMLGKSHCEVIVFLKEELHNTKLIGAQLCAFYILSKILYGHQSISIFRFQNVGGLANFSRKYNVEIIDHIDCST